jgi:hypothetical protein
VIENCTRYTSANGYEDEWLAKHKCQCPVCKGFLSWDDNGEPHCNKCEAELVLVPDIDEDTKDILEEGKICAISGRKKTQEDYKQKRLGKDNEKLWRAFL